MKIEIDTKKQTITLLEEVSLSELNDFMKIHFPGENNYKIISKQTIQIVKESIPKIDKITPWVDPLYPPIFREPSTGDPLYPTWEGWKPTA